MVYRSKIIVLLLGISLTHVALAQPDRDSLLEAWERYVAALPGTSSFEASGDGMYLLEDTDLPYTGDVRVVGALVRPAESPGVQTGFTHIGMVEFELVDWPVERLASQNYYYWLADRQTLHYSADEQRWVDPASYQASLASQYGLDGNFGALSFMLNYGIWVLMITLIVFVFLAVHRQTKKARSLMDETKAINQQARENIDRAAGLQDEVLSIARATRDLHAESNELLKEMLAALRN